MTDAEDAHNAELNELIRACPHDSIRKVDGEIRCGFCPARFAVCDVCATSSSVHNRSG
jgi:hypothetical protein